MTRARGYSLWLMPTDDSYKTLSRVISELSKNYSTPFFESHVTLLGELSGTEEIMLSKTEQLSSRVSPFDIKLTYVDYTDQYFRCLFLRAEETIELMRTNQKAREIFNRQQDPKFVPHLSLMYGNFSQQVKDRIVRELGGLDTSFKVKSIHLFSTNGEPKDWYRVKEFPFK